MKKWLAAITGLLILAGCSNNSDTPMKMETTDADTPIVEPFTEKQPADEEAPVGGESSMLNGLPEYNTISEHLQLADLEPVIETDNQGDRVILYHNASGQAVYKSVFIKHDERLKIIKLADEGLLYNDIIK